VTEQTGIIKAIAWRAAKGDALQESDHCQVNRNTGIGWENRKPGKRSLTLMSIEHWRDVCEELGVQLPWTMRRANLLVEGLELASAIGKPIHIGQVRVWIHGETKPCQLMDDQYQGLLDTLKPDFRGGVYGQVLNEGTIYIGDSLVINQSRCKEQSISGRQV